MKAIIIGKLNTLTPECTFEQVQACVNEIKKLSKNIKKINKLFSKDIMIKNETVQEEKYSIVFDEETEMYIIKTIGLTPEYTPQLESAETKRNETVLTVGCHKSEKYKQDSSGNIVIPEAEKRLIITLSKDESGYHISEISG